MHTPTWVITKLCVQKFPALIVNLIHIIVYAKASCEAVQFSDKISGNLCIQFMSFTNWE